ncbi:MAG: hypothetical protein E4H36_14090 [Spirochaetales bacterium]|nr:MAG: hypothetical protein E4H36_14090 [Spirochaetales bacterium]
MNNSEPLEVVSDLVDIAGRLTSTTVVVAGGERVEDLKLVEAAQDHGIIDRIILVGNKQKIAQSIEATGITIDPKDIVHAEDDDHTAAATVELIENNVVDIVLKGNISTPVINRYMLPMAMRTTVSLASIFDAAPIANGRPMILTDAGVTTVCNFGRLTDLITNAVDVAQVVMGIERPRVALLSANEKQIPSLASTWLGLELAERTWENAVVCGPLSFDLATDPGSVEIKGMPELPNAAEVAGRADILVCPGIDSANILYKAIASMAKYGEASIAGITIGFPVPYIILSRSDPMETRLQSIALCSIYASRKSERKKTAPGPAPVPTEAENILTLKPDDKTVKGAVYSNELCIFEFEAARKSGIETGQLTDLIPEIKKELERNGVSSLKAVAGTMNITEDFSGIEQNRLYLIPDAMESADLPPMLKLLSGLSKNYSALAYFSVDEGAPFTGPHAYSLLNAAGPPRYRLGNLSNP